MISSHAALPRTADRKADAPSDRAGQAPAAFAAAAAAQDRAGLCTTCEQRRACTFPFVPGGVWYCEEFE